MKKTVNTFEFAIGFFSAFVLTSVLFTFILVEGFVAKEFLQQNRIYLDGRMYQLCRIK